MKYEVIDTINPDEFEPGKLHRRWLSIVENGVGQPILIPVIIGKGRKPGPIVGITAAVHGNELNGLRVIQDLMDKLGPIELRGTVVGIPVVNIPSLLIHDRRFVDGEDLNRIMPGRPDGNQSEIYAWRFTNRVLSKFNYLFDLHTASSGRTNSFYIRADLNDPTIKRMALLQNADIILHSEGHEGNLRSVAMDMGIKAMTLEVGNPNKFNSAMIRSGLDGIWNVLADLKMIDSEVSALDESVPICKKSYWIYTSHGGILEVYPELTDEVRKGDVIASLKNVFGDMIEEYLAPEDGIVIGKSVMPVGQTGSRILHLGIHQ